MDECKVIIMGFGSVGQGVADAISMKKDLIKEKTGVAVKVVAAADSSTSAISQDGLDEKLLVETKKNEGKFTGFLGWMYDFLTFKKMVIENILKILYLILAEFITLA